MDVEVLSRAVKGTTHAQGVYIAAFIPLEYLHDATRNRDGVANTIGIAILEAINDWRKNAPDV